MFRFVLSINIVKVEFSLEQVTKARKGSRGIEVCTVSLTTAFDGSGWLTPRPGLFTPGRDPVPIYSRLVGPEGRFERVRKIPPPPGFDSRTVHPVPSRYTDYAILAQL